MRLGEYWAMYLPPQYPKLSDLKKARLDAGLKQTDLEKLSGVSQSIITKVERGQRKPQYETAVKLFMAISDHNAKQAKGDMRRASKIMSKKVKSFQVSVTVHHVIKAMKKFDISSFPVYEGNDLIGTVTERSLLGADVEDSLNDYLVDALPILSKNTPVCDLERILKLYSVVLLSNKNGKIMGICSRQDILQ